MAKQMNDWCDVASKQNKKYDVISIKYSSGVSVHYISYTGGGVGAGRLATAAAALSAGLGSWSHLT